MDHGPSSTDLPSFREGMSQELLKVVDGEGGPMHHVVIDVDPGHGAIMGISLLYIGKLVICFWG